MSEISPEERLEAYKAVNYDLYDQRMRERVDQASRVILDRAVEKIRDDRRRLDALERMPMPLDVVGGGGALIVKQEVFGPATTFVAAGGQVNLDWGSSFGPDVLVTKETPGNVSGPAFLANGFYLINLSIKGDGITNGFAGYIEGPNAGFQYFSANALGGASQIRTGRMIAGRGQVNSDIKISVTNYDASGRNITIEPVYIYKIDVG